MQINSIQNYSLNSLKNNRKNQSFGRELRPEERKECAQACNEARELLGIKNLSLIMHGSSFPADNRDFYIGSFFNDKAQKVYDFINMFGFNSDQLGPNGMLSKRDVSPYGSRAFSQNYLFIDLNKLATPEYANILSDANLEAYKNKSELGDMTNFDKAFAAYDKLLYNAYMTLQHKDEIGDEKAVKLMSEFTQYQENSGNWLKSDAMFDLLRKHFYDGAPIGEWSDIDRNMNTYLLDENHPKHQEALSRKENLEQIYEHDLNLYAFKQFLYDKQLSSFMEETNQNVGFIGDALVGFSASDVWGNPDAFLSGYGLGCPNGGRNNSNQTWGIPVLDPKKLFNKDGSLGSAGKLLRAKFEHILGNAKTVRIDHAIGLVDPWCYSIDSVHEAHGGTYSDGNNISNLPHLDPGKNFSKVLEKIILPLLEEKGINKDDVVWEDLGSQTQAFKDTYYGKANLAGIKNFRYVHAEQLMKENDGYNIDPRRHWWNIGTHDDKPILGEINKFAYVPPEQNYNQVRNKGFDPYYLAGYLYPNWSWQQREPLARTLEQNPVERMKYKFVEMLAMGKNIQIFFSDFFGIDKNRLYNKVGEQNDTNWRLRLTPNFDKEYYKTLENPTDDKVALNMPELFAAALRSKLSWGIKDSQKREKAEALIQELDKFKNILYEKS